MVPAHRLHDISDNLWELLKPYLPGREGAKDVTARDNRLFINAFFWILRTGSPWRDLPPEYGDWKNTHRRFCKWRDNGFWEKLLEILIDEPNFEWLMLDASYIKVHQDGTGTKGGNQGIGRTKGGSTQRYIWPWMRMVCGQNGYHVRYRCGLHAGLQTHGGIRCWLYSCR